MSTYILPALPGHVVVRISGQEYYLRTADNRLFYPDLTPVIPYTPSENREIAYETMPIVSYNDEKLTVDQANDLFWKYFPDASKHAVAEELQNKISEAKEQIRTMYPDENVTEDSE